MVLGALGSITIQPLAQLGAFLLIFYADLAMEYGVYWSVIGEPEWSGIVSD